MKTDTADERLLKALNILTCAQTRQQLRSLLREELASCQEELVREHLSICNACSDVLMDLIDTGENTDTISTSECLNGLPQLPEFVLVRRDQLPKNHEKQGAVPTESKGDVSLIPDCDTAMFVHNGKVFLDANRTGLQLLGATIPNEIVGQRVLEFIHQDFWDIARRQGKRVKNEGMPSALVEERLVRLDGRIIDVETLALPINYRGQQAVQIVVKDITDHKKIERALQRYAARYQIMTESSTDAIISLSPTLMILYSSQAGEQLFGYERREVLRRSAVTFIHPDDFSEVEKAHATVLDNSDIQRACFRIRQKAGTYIWVEATIQGIREPETNRLRKIVAVARRATDYKQVERERFLEFQKALEIYKRIFDEVAFGMAIMNLETGRFLEVNPAYCEMVGYTADELRARTFYDITDPDDVQRSREVHDALRSGQAVLRKFDKRYRHKNGAPVHGQLTTIGLCHIEGGGSALLSIVEDVSQHKPAPGPADSDKPGDWVERDRAEPPLPHIPVGPTKTPLGFWGLPDSGEVLENAKNMAKRGETDNALQLLFAFRKHLKGTRQKNPLLLQQIEGAISSLKEKIKNGERVGLSTHS
ncbi:MAG: PAS domain S-box protein [Deltaproteobacteria bacterium]|nr:PAS domain S-box protein [Deltaproteobacteria bacterium]